MTFPVGFIEFHPNNVINFQMNRLYSSGYLDRDALIEAGKKIQNFNDWTKEFCVLAEDAHNKGNLFACATYYRAAQFFSIDDEQDDRGQPQKITLYEKCMAAYEQTYQDSEIKYTRIPFENGYLPVLYKLQKNPKGTVIIHGGYDSFIQEFIPYLKYIYENGYDIYLFEGYGQGEVLNRCNIKMKPEWEKCTSEVLDHFNLNNVTLIGVSLGGYLAGRAAAFEKRIHRVVLYDIVYDFYGAVMHSKPALIRMILKLLLRIPKSQIWERMEKKTCENFFGNWLLKQGMYVFENVHTLPEYLTCIQQYNTRKISKLIHQDVLMLAGADDIYTVYFEEQKKALMNAKSVEGRIFTKAESASHHCQIGNIKLALDYILDWINQKQYQ